MYFILCHFCWHFNHVFAYWTAVWTCPLSNISCSPHGVTCFICPIFFIFIHDTLVYAGSNIPHLRSKCHIMHLTYYIVPWYYFFISLLRWPIAYPDSPSMADPLMDEMIRCLLPISAGGIKPICTSGEVHPSPALISSLIFFFFSGALHNGRTFSASLVSDVTIHVLFLRYVNIPSLCYLWWRLHAWSGWWTVCLAWSEYLERYTWSVERQ